MSSTDALMKLFDNECLSWRFRQKTITEIICRLIPKNIRISWICIFREKGFLIEEPIWTQFYALFANRFSDRSKRPLRVWVVGCGRGGEAFGVAIALAEILGTNSGAIKIFATDTDDTKIAAGRQSILSGID